MITTPITTNNTITQPLHVSSAFHAFLRRVRELDCIFFSK
jgi:hypothetical protein